METPHLIFLQVLLAYKDLEVKQDSQVQKVTFSSPWQLKHH